MSSSSIFEKIYAPRWAKNNLSPPIVHENSTCIVHLS
jgi:hypothetical protein